MNVHEIADPTEELRVEYSPIQFDLPLRSHRCPTSELWPGVVEWPTPGQVLTDFLESISVSRPEDTAFALLQDFGSLSALLAGSRWRLMRAVGPRLASTIRHSRELMRAVLAERVLKGPVLAGDKAVVDFLRNELGGLRHERLLALYVDIRLHLLRIERLGDGSKDQAPFEISRIIHCALDVGAGGIIVVHNHPSGVPEPSREDLAITRQLSNVAEGLRIKLIDHLIVTQNEIVSLRKLGVL